MTSISRPISQMEQWFPSAEPTQAPAYSDDGGFLSGVQSTGAGGAGLAGLLGLQGNGGNIDPYLLSLMAGQQSTAPVDQMARWFGGGQPSQPGAFAPSSAADVLGQITGSPAPVASPAATPQLDPGGFNISPGQIISGVGKGISGLQNMTGTDFGLGDVLPYAGLAGSLANFASNPSVGSGMGVGGAGLALAFPELGPFAMVAGMAANALMSNPKSPSTDAAYTLGPQGAFQFARQGSQDGLDPAVGKQIGDYVSGSVTDRLKAAGAQFNPSFAGQEVNFGYTPSGGLQANTGIGAAPITANTGEGGSTPDSNGQRRIGAGRFMDPNLLASAYYDDLMQQGVFSDPTWKPQSQFADPAQRGGDYADGGSIQDGSHIFPSDVLAAAGNGDNRAGARRLGVQLVSGPGDGRSDSVPFNGPGGRRVRLSTGEGIMSPDRVQGIGGHDAADRMILRKRKKFRNAMGAFGRPGG